MNNFKWSLVKCWWNYYIFFLCKTFPYWYTGIYVRSWRHPILAKMILYSVLSTNKLLKLGPSLCWFILRTAIRNLKAWIHNNIAQNTMWHNQLISSPPPPPPPPVPHICVSESGQHWFRWWLGAYSAPSHYLNQCLNIVNWTLRNKLWWNFNQNSNFFIQEYTFENVFCEMAAILSRGRSVNHPCPRFLLVAHECSFFWSKTIHLLYVSLRQNVGQRDHITIFQQQARYTTVPFWLIGPWEIWMWF